MCSWIPYVPRRSRVKAAALAIWGPSVIEPERLERVKSLYGFVTTGDRNLRLGRRSRNMVLNTDEGRIVLKHYRPEWGSETVACAHSILLELEANGFPAPRLILTSSGLNRVVDDGEVFAALRFIPGTNYSITYLRRRDRLAITVEAAQTMARLHKSLDDFIPAGQHHHGFATRTSKARRDMEWHTSMVDELIVKSSQSIMDPRESDLAGRLISRSSHVLDSLGGLDNTLAEGKLPRLVIHGDYGIHNLLFPRAGSPTPIDFELSRLDWRINDLISAVGKHRFKGQRYDFESMRTFMAAYDGSYPLSEQERALFVEAWRFYKLRAAVQYWNSYFQTNGPARKLRSALDSIKQADWVRDHPEAVRDLARRA